MKISPCRCRSAGSLGKLEFEPGLFASKINRRWDGEERKRIHTDPNFLFSANLSWIRRLLISLRKGLEKNTKPSYWIQFWSVCVTPLQLSVPTITQGCFDTFLSISFFRQGQFYSPHLWITQYSFSNLEHNCKYLNIWILYKL